MKLWLKIAMVAVMTLAILIPLMMVRGVIAERQRYRNEAVADIAANIGGAQILAGPVLVVPYSEMVTSEQGNGQVLRVRKQKQWTFFPETLRADGVLKPDKRKRGLHEVRVYEWQGQLQAKFQARLPGDAGDGRIIGQPFLSWGVSDVRGLRGTPVVSINGQAATPEQGAGIGQSGGLHVMLPAALPGSTLDLDARLSIALAGTERFAILPLARSNDLSLKSSWAHPSFAGILPRHDINAQGFNARWQVDALATNAQSLWREGNWAGNGRDLAGVSLVEPVNPYLQADRATKYGVLFVVLTFVGFFMFELLKQIPVHPIQYALVGLAIAIFFLLLVSLSEHLEFGIAYLLAAVACIGLIGFYLSAVLRSAARGAGFAAMLATLYAALYGLLVLEDNALAVGSGLLFAILAGIMIATRKVDWYALGNARIAVPPISRPQA